MGRAHVGSRDPLVWVGSGLKAFRPAEFHTNGPDVKYLSHVQGRQLLAAMRPAPTYGKWGVSHPYLDPPCNIHKLCRQHYGIISDRYIIKIVHIATTMQSNRTKPEGTKVVNDYRKTRPYLQLHKMIKQHEMRFQAAENSMPS